MEWRFAFEWLGNGCDILTQWPSKVNQTLFEVSFYIMSKIVAYHRRASTPSRQVSARGFLLHILEAFVLHAWKSNVFFCNTWFIHKLDVRCPHSHFDSTRVQIFGRVNSLHAFVAAHQENVETALCWKFNYVILMFSIWSTNNSC